MHWPKLQYSREDTPIFTYLMLPYALYSLFWLKWFIGIPLFVLLFSCVWRMQKSDGVSSEASAKKAFDQAALMAVVILFFWTWYSGIGGHVFQNYDWKKHNGILIDLTKQPWPVTYQTLGKHSSWLMVYYVAFYLPSAGIAKLIGGGFETAQGVLFVWTMLGLWLLFKEFRIQFKQKSMLALIIFVLFSGMDIFGYLYHTSQGMPYCYDYQPLEGLRGHLECWTGLISLMQYSSFTTLLFWVPQHAVGGWLCTALLYRHRKDYNVILLVWCLSILYSPFVFIGLAPFVFTSVYGAIKEKHMRRLLSVQNVAGAVIGLVIGLYYLSNKAQAAFPKAFLWEVNTDGTALKLYFAFVLFEFLLLSALLLLGVFKDRQLWKDIPWFAAMNIVLLLLPLYKYGYYNDLCMRASIPALFVLFILTVKVLLSDAASKMIKGMIILLLIIGAVTPIQEVNRARYYKSQTDDVLLASVLEMDEMFIDQYIDKQADQNLYYRWFLAHKAMPELQDDN